MRSGPLQNIRVIDLATFLAGPFCATIFAEFGADVIKVEQPDTGDPCRQLGTMTDAGDTMIWLSEARNKRSVTLDLRTPEGVAICKRLVAHADVVVENFRPGVLEKWGLGYEDLKAVNPRIVMVRISGYGQTGPYRHRPGFARIAHAFSGLVYLAGEPGRPPVMPGSTSLADYMSGVWAALGAMIALHARETTGQGQYVDLALYESIFRFLDELVPAYDKLGFVRERMGADTVNVVPHSHYPTADGKWVAIACSSDKMFDRLAAAMDRPELATDPQYDRMSKRLDRREEVNRLVSDWTESLPAEEVLLRCERASVPCSLLYSIRDIFEDRHYAERQNIHRVRGGRVEDFPLPNIVPRLSETPGEIRSLGPALGEHTDEVYRELLGMSPDELAALRERKII